jgi:hypothetical protein
MENPRLAPTRAIGVATEFGFPSSHIHYCSCLKKMAAIKRSEAGADSAKGTEISPEHVEALQNLSKEFVRAELALGEMPHSRMSDSRLTSPRAQGHQGNAPFV